MKSKIPGTISALLISMNLLCSGGVSKNPVSESDIDTILQEFTQSRIDQYLYSEENPKDNLTILVMILNRHNFNFNTFIEALKKSKPGIYESLTGGIPGK